MINIINILQESKVWPLLCCNVNSMLIAALCCLTPKPSFPKHAYTHALGVPEIPHLYRLLRLQDSTVLFPVTHSSVHSIVSCSMPT